MKRLLMNLSFYAAALMTVACAFSGTAMAQSTQPAQPVKGTNDPFGAVPDTVYAEINRIDKSNWSVTITVFNDAPLAGLQIPIRYKGGNVQMVADSAVFAGSRVSDWDMSQFRCDTAIQAFRILLVANMGPTQKKLIPGSGRITTVFISSLEDEPVENLTIDTTTINDLNLLFVADMNQTKNGKPMTVDPARREIRPAWVVRKRDH